MNVVGNKHIFLVISGILVAASLFAIGAFGFRQGIDFQGGALWTFTVAGQEPAAENIHRIFRDKLGFEDARVSYDASRKSFLVRLPATREEDHAAYRDAIKTEFPSLQELSFQSIGPSVGAELKRKSFLAVGFVLAGISIYIAFAFRKVMRPISSWKYGWVTLLTLFHDVAIPAGLLALLGRLQGIEIDGNFVVALLVVMGFSVHDTIVVFDRIRENLFLNRGTADFANIVNQSVNQSLARSVNTSLTLILVLLALLFVGPATLKYFVLTLLVGVTTGVYSSIFVASPLLLVWQEWSARRRA